MNVRVHAFGLDIFPRAFVKKDPHRTVRVVFQVPREELRPGLFERELRAGAAEPSSGVGGPMIRTAAWM